MRCGLPNRTGTHLHLNLNFVKALFSPIPKCLELVAFPTRLSFSVQIYYFLQDFVSSDEGVGISLPIVDADMLALLPEIILLYSTIGSQIVHTI